MNLFDVIKKPLITEKSTLIRETRNAYVFAVDYGADKPTIKRAVETLFKVKVSAVRTAIVPGRKKRAGFRTVKGPSWKKAIVTLEQGQTIDIMAGA